MSKEQRLIELRKFFKAGPLNPWECIEFAWYQSPHVHRPHPREEVWTLGKHGVKEYPSYYAAMRERFRGVLNEAIRLCETGLPGLLACPRTMELMPVTMRKMAETGMRKKNPQPRKGWKWSDEARARLSIARTGKVQGTPRKRGYPLYSLGSPIPATGHRFTITRADLEKLLSMVLPAGL